MKKLLCILLTLCLTSVAWAVENPFAPYDLSLPEGCELQEMEGTYTFVSGKTRVVAMALSRLPDEVPADAIIRLMGQFEPNAIIGEDIPLVEGYVGVEAVAEDRFGEGIDQKNLMVLGADGALLILSGYDMDGDMTRVDALLNALLTTLKVDGVPLWLDPDA